jgi:predicted DNA-binding transcriptional regulator AlpA
VEYEFRFVVEGASVDDAEIVELLSDELDAMLFRGGGVDLLDIAADGETALEAAMTAARAVVELVPSLRLLHIHRDLVGIPEIAERVGVTRQNVHQWINGERRKGAPLFPRPEGTAGRSSVWLWAEVNDWLNRQGLGDGVRLPSRYDMAEIDSALAHELHYRTPSSLDRWQRNRRIGAVVSYSVSLRMSESEDQNLIEDGFETTWATVSVDYLAAVQ